MPSLCHPLNTEMHRLGLEPSSVHVAGEPLPRVNVMGWSHKKVGNTSRVEDLWAGFWIVGRELCQAQREERCQAKEVDAVCGLRRKPKGK